MHPLSHLIESQKRHTHQQMAAAQRRQRSSKPAVEADESSATEASRSRTPAPRRARLVAAIFPRSGQRAR